MTEITIEGLKKKRRVGEDKTENKPAVAEINIETGKIISIDIFEPSWRTQLWKSILNLFYALAFLGCGWLLASLFGAC